MLLPCVTAALHAALIEVWLAAKRANRSTAGRDRMTCDLRGARIREDGIIGAGPAGLTAAHQLAKAGADVEVFEADEVVGARRRGAAVRVVRRLAAAAVRPGDLTVLSRCGRR
jgi:hypothetical protein